MDSLRLARSRVRSVMPSAFAMCFTSGDQAEGMAAFLERRTANFTGR